MSTRINQQWRNDNTGATVTITKSDGNGLYAMGDAPNNWIPYPPAGYTKVAASPQELTDALQARLDAAGIP